MNPTTRFELAHRFASHCVDFQRSKDTMTYSDYFTYILKNIYKVELFAKAHLKANRFVYLEISDCKQLFKLQDDGKCTVTGRYELDGANHTYVLGLDFSLYLIASNAVWARNPKLQSSNVDSHFRI